MLDNVKIILNIYNKILYIDLNKNMYIFDNEQTSQIKLQVIEKKNITIIPKTLLHKN
ncbi:hypothetical protein PIROE2DRAFT_18505 [Piromyces sp. E2]|nr:hypothetical protein PIROE2DRAFT_18505 [Piromyces sp. E2]|eukprot:OUM56752.1 hypothetical protein PIROE2DRAFT_18505 [Piromyces sp. E2]